MKYLSLFSFLFLILTAGYAQEKPSIKLYGFVRNEFAADTYRGVDAFNDIFYLLPIYAENSAGEEINKDFESYMTAAATRLGTKISGPNLGNAKTSAVIEFDFGGLTSSYPSLFRIRHAYTNLAWEKSSLLIGQTWHPFWCGSNFPKTAGLNTGAPFQAFNRSPMVRYNYDLNKETKLSIAAVYENQYTSKSLYAISDDVDKTKAQRYGGVPEIVIGLSHKNETMGYGLFAEYKTILPTDINNNAIKTSALKTSYGVTAYAKYNKKKLYLLAKGTFGQDLAHLTMPGGYGVSNVKQNGDYEYTNYNNLAVFANAVYGKKWQIGAFIGYGKNFGTSKALYNFTPNESSSTTITAGLFQTVQHMNRASIHGALNISNFRFVAEYEMTTANYGTGTFDLSDGLYSDINSATNHRTILMMMYMF